MTDNTQLDLEDCDPEEDPLNLNQQSLKSIHFVAMDFPKTTIIETAHPKLLAGFFMNAMSLNQTLEDTILSGFERKAEIVVPFRQLSSFVHKGEPSKQVSNFSSIVNDFHLEFIIFAKTFCELFEGKIKEICGPDQVENLKFLYNDSKSNFCFKDFDLSKLSSMDSFTVALDSDKRPAMTFTIPNENVGYRGQVLLETILALYVQSINGMNRPIEMFKWIRDTAGLQDTVFDTLLNVCNFVRNQVEKTGVNPDDFNLDIAKAKRAHLKSSLVEHQKEIKIAAHLSYLYDLNFKLYSSFTNKFIMLSGLDELDGNADEDGDQFLEVGACIYALGANYYANNGLNRDNNKIVPFEFCKEMMDLGNQVASGDKITDQQAIYELFKNYRLWTKQHPNLSVLSDYIPL